MMKNLMKYTFLTCLLTSFLTVSAQKAEFGLASYYGKNFQGSKTASGESYDKDELTAAHRTLPFNTIIKVTRLKNGKSVEVRVNDRGPFREGHRVDLSKAAASKLDLIKIGKDRVKIEVVKLVGKTKAEPLAKAPKKTEKSKNTAKSITKEVAKRDVPKEYNKATKKKVVKEAVSSNKNGPNGLFKLEAMMHDKAGYGIQVGNFSDFKLLVNEAAKLRKKGFKNVLVSIEDDKYKLILAPFEDIKTAQVYKKDLKRRYKINGFMINLATLKH